MNIAIIDYESGNISSVINSFKLVSKNTNIDIKIKVTSDSKIISNSDKVILPGQGSFKECMESLLKIKNLRESLENFAIIKAKPLFGICVGMQMFADIGLEDQKTKGFGWIPGKVVKIDNKNNKFKLPHMGWNDVIPVESEGLFRGIAEPRYYFLHSYCIVPRSQSNVLATAQYGRKFTAAVQRGNVFGTQFHPEKSHENGLQLLKNFAEL